ncbi:hypothetical protein M2437_003526 [Methylorubrum pseudosasae]|nr:hypothetical protein [Methylorubrum pseudosasae]
MRASLSASVSSGKFLAQQAQNQREVIGPQRLDRGQHQPAGQRRAAPLDGECQQALCLAQHHPGLPHDPLPRHRQQHATVGSFEQGQPERVFQFTNLHGERRLAHVAALGSPAEMPFIGNSDDIFEIAQGQPGKIHRLHLSQRL